MSLQEDGAAPSVASCSLSLSHCLFALTACDLHDQQTKTNNEKKLSFAEKAQRKKKESLVRIVFLFVVSLGHGAATAVRCPSECRETGGR